jgi:hypothetical protein
VVGPIFECRTLLLKPPYKLTLFHRTSLLCCRCSYNKQKRLYKKAFLFIKSQIFAGIAQLVERKPSKLYVAGSNPVARSSVSAQADRSRASPPAAVMLSRLFYSRCPMSREPLYMKVSIGGDVVRRVADPLHFYDKAGHIVATCMRPRLEPGEILQERIGTFPAIIRTAA